MSAPTPTPTPTLTYSRKAARRRQRDENLPFMHSLHPTRQHKRARENTGSLSLALWSPFSHFFISRWACHRIVFERFKESQKVFRLIVERIHTLVFFERMPNLSYAQHHLTQRSSLTHPLAPPLHLRLSTLLPSVRPLNQRIRSQDRLPSHLCPRAR